MYGYDDFDRAFVRERAQEFRNQTERRLAGALSEEQFRPLRLMNGLYLQLHAYMLRVAVPYGSLSSRQLRKLARIARKYDRGYGHFTTRQNIQYNWIQLKDAPDILDELAEVEMHAIQTSGNCIRNVTSDPFAGASADEVADPRPFGEILRQWSSLHPEFSFLPRKFKIAIIGAPHDRAVMQAHDIGLEVKRDASGALGFAVYAGGGLGRTPMQARKLRDFLPQDDLIAYCEAILRIYNLEGRRDNKYKARIKILVHEVGEEKFRDMVEQEFAAIDKALYRLEPEEVARIQKFFAPPPFEQLPSQSKIFDDACKKDNNFAAFVERNIAPHKQPGYGIMTISLKPVGAPPGDASAEQIEAIADLAEKYSFDEARVSHNQNIILPHVKLEDAPKIYEILAAHGLGEANAGLISDIIACPGLDYCTLANARSIPVAQNIARRFKDPARQRLIGDLQLKISGCINACGHHHVGHIGILGVDRKGEEFYQVTLGGSGDERFAIGEIVGRGFSEGEIVGAIDKIVDAYLLLRENPEETFIAAYRRLGSAPFKEALYASQPV